MSTDKDNQIFTFLNKYQTGVLATVDINGHPSASVIYYKLGPKGDIFFITKSSTAKYRNILTNPNVSLCVYDEDERATAELTGKAFEVKKEDEQIKILDELAIVRHGKGHSWLPPIADLKDGKIVVMRIEIGKSKFFDFKHHTKA